MIESELVLSFKKKYGIVYSVNIKNTTLIFRELTFEEYNDVISRQNLDDSTSSADLEDLILSYSIIYPENFDIYKIPPGNVSTLAQDILDLSGITSAKVAIQVLEEKRFETNEVKNLMKAFVLATINAYTPEDLEKMTFSQLAEKVALSEKIIEIKQGINGFEPTNLTLRLIDPEAEEQKQRTTAARHNLSKTEGEANYEDPIAQKLWGMK